ncbi:MAG: hypothetical protein IJC64_01945 [Clostridia bacterium]|nr:hypothetical protein [Clostridia bacterium]
MGKMLGAFDNPEELDRPDLNKCPDCECYFAGDNCPLCGKVCPEEMRAGNRKPPKKQKHRRRSSSGRVVFVEWYHTWWCILLATIFMAPLGIILMLTSPHKTVYKVIFTVAVVLVEFVIPAAVSVIFALIEAGVFAQGAAVFALFM